MGAEAAQGMYGLGVPSQSALREQRGGAHRV